MKELRSVRKEWITRASARLKEQKKNLKAIKGHLEEGPGTVPRIAEATGISPDRVLWYIAALKKYGEISEAEKDGSYFLNNKLKAGLYGNKVLVEEFNSKLSVQVILN